MKINPRSIGEKVIHLLKTYKSNLPNGECNTTCLLGTPYLEIKGVIKDPFMSWKQTNNTKVLLQNIHLFAQT